MNTENNISSENAEIKLVPPGKKPPIAATVVCVLIAAVSIAFLPEFGYLSIIISVAGVIYTVSAKAPVPVFFIPLVGIAVSALRGGLAVCGIAVAVTAAAVFSGSVLRSGGDFHRALMAFTLVTFTAVVAAVAIYTRLQGITVKDIYDAFTGYIHNAMASAVESFGDRMSLETAQLMIEQYEEIIAVSLPYIPSVIAWMIEVCGIIALRLAGLLHDITGSELYPEDKRPAVLSRAFAVLYFVSLFMGALDSGIVGYCAGNIMLIFMLPAAAAGVSAYRGMLRQRRESGKRGMPPSLMMLILVFVLMSPVFGIVVLALTGAFAAFRRRPKSSGND